MRNFFILFLFLVCANVFAATGSGNVSTVTSVGGVNTNDAVNTPNSNPDGYITLFSGRSITAGNAGVVYKNGVAYQVPAGKTFIMNKICYVHSGARSQLLTSTTSFANDVGLGTLGSPAYMGGATGADFLTMGAATTWICISSFYSVAQNLYLGFTGDTSTGYNILITGKEI